MEVFPEVLVLAEAVRTAPPAAQAATFSSPEAASRQQGVLMRQTLEAVITMPITAC